jgi:tRNA A-37 threonylcarbamoyl transferase component Bud32
MLSENIQNFTTRILARFHRRVELVPAICRKPDILRYWLLSARKAQLFSIALLVLIPFAILPFVDFLLSSLFSPITEEVLFGLIKTEHENPYIEIFQNIVFWLVWALSALYSISLLLRHIPETIKHADNEVKVKTFEADQLISTNPAESILLYNTARRWSITDDDEATLNTKLQYANVVAYNNSSKKTQVMPAQTVILSNLVNTSSNTVIADRYKINQLIGSGAMGNVYHGEDTLLKRNIALKQLSPQFSHDEHIIARFRQEALALARLSHSNIVQVYDFIEDAGFLWIIMELVTGGELEDKLANNKKLVPDEAISLTIQMASALGHAHNQGVIHRDFKPANVLLTNNSEIKITDFGIAKLAQSSIHTQLNTVMGTPSYMSPEQANGEETDLRTDIYALGIVLYQMLSGDLPFTGDAKTIIAQHLTKTPPTLINKTIKSELDSIVQKMLQKDPEKRYLSMDELIKAISDQGLN